VAEVTFEDMKAGDSIFIPWECWTLKKNQDFSDMPSFVDMSALSILDDSLDCYLQASTYIQSDHPDIILKAEEIADGDLNGFQSQLDSAQAKYNDIETVNIPAEQSCLQFTEYTLFQNYPNPFNPVTAIQLNLPKSSFVSVKIYDLLGREIKTLADGRIAEGEHLFQWDASDLPSGIYFCRLRTDNYIETRKLVLHK
jgi:hypothetical protein